MKLMLLIPVSQKETHGIIAFGDVEYFLGMAQTDHVLL